MSPAMRPSVLVLIVAIAFGAAGPTVLRAQEKTDEASRAPARDIKIAPVSTQHRLNLPGRAIDYRAVAETLPVVDDKGATTAQVAVIGYTVAGSDPAARPVTFVFNGGPGVSSAFLHFGALGPKALVSGPNGGVPAPPARLRDNPDSWLAFTDLVFVDPVGTGYSRASQREDDAERSFWSVSGDVRSLSEVIRLWLTRNGRWTSPKFIAGESYGGFRAAKLARALLDDHGAALNGVILISPALEFSTISPGRHNLLPWALVLPSMVASARAHGKGDAALSLDEVERFALTDYLSGIAAIAPSGPGPDRALLDRLSGLLGLEIDLVRRHHGRVSAGLFAEHLLEKDGLSLSLYDGTITAPDPQPGGRRGPDPQLDAIKAPLSTAYNAYLRDELKVETDLPFRLLNRDVSRRWDWEGARGRRGDDEGAMDDLAETIALIPGFRVLVVHGRTDLVTPYMTSRWLLDRLDLPEDVRARVQFEVLEGGHMMYFRDDQRAVLGRLAGQFYGEASPGTGR